MIKLYSLRGFLLLFIFSVSISTSCKKKEQAAISTDLKINVRIYSNHYYGDNYYNYSKYYEADSATGSNATVMLFKSLVDMEARVRPVRIEQTDANGDLTMKGVEPFPYFIYVYYDNNVNYYDNSIGNYNLADAMVEGGITAVSIPIYKTRPSLPQKIGINYIEVIRYDTLVGGCSKNLKFVFYDDLNNPLDSTSNSSFCPKRATTADNARQFYFGNSDYWTYPNPDSTYDISNFGVNNYFKITLFENDTAVSDVYRYPLDYQKNNVNKYLPYPVRVRLWEDEHKIIYMNWSWK